MREGTWTSLLLQRLDLGRPTFGLRSLSKENKKYAKEAAMEKSILPLQAGIHAREWISPAVATFLVRELVEDYAEHPDYIDKINWYA